MIPPFMCSYPNLSHDWGFEEYIFTDDRGNEILFNVPVCSNCGYKFYEIHIQSSDTSAKEEEE